MSVENILFFKILGLPGCAYIFGGCMFALVGTFLWAVAAAETELDKLREARREWRKAKAERDAALFARLLIKRH